MSDAAPRPVSARAPCLDAAWRRRAALGEAAHLLALLGLAGGVYTMLVLLPGKLATRDLRARRDAARLEVQELERSIATIERDAAALDVDPWAIERALRRRLGYLRPDERVHRP